MRKGLLPSLLISFILLCGCAGPETDPGLALRSRILEKGCCFDAEITADYGDSLSVFAMHLLADGLLTPAAAPWIFVRTLRSGNLIASGREGDVTRLSIDDSFREDALRLDIWLDEAGNPAKADISCKEQRYLSMVVQNFRTESEAEA